MFIITNCITTIAKLLGSKFVEDDFIFYLDVKKVKLFMVLLHYLIVHYNPTSKT